MVVAFLCSYSYSYSEVLTTRTSNAAEFGLSWAIKQVLPQISGLDVIGVNYRYTAVKATQDPLVVTVGTLNAKNNYVFRSEDNWTGLPSNTITKTVAVVDYSLSSWNRGQITAAGIGSIRDSYVSYIYRYDSCKVDPVVDTSCPNYKSSATHHKLNQITDSSLDSFSLNNSQFIEKEEQTLEKHHRLMLQAEERKVTAVSRGNNLLITSVVDAQARALLALNNRAEFNQYTIPLAGGAYPESLRYTDKVLPDSSSARRFNLSQQRLHNAMIELQYTR